MNQKNQLVRSNQKKWKSLTGIDEGDVTGVYVKPLLYDEETRRSPTILLKFDPGASYPLHTHPGGEEVFVLEGDIRLGKDHLFAGDYLFTAPDNLHAARTEGGCVVLLKAPLPTEFR
ncbi:MAG: cupin domain-containing protein [Pyrinomonadaceae bacterium]